MRSFAAIRPLSFTFAAGCSSQSLFSYRFAPYAIKFLGQIFISSRATHSELPSGRAGTNVHFVFAIRFGLCARFENCRTSYTNQNLAF